MKICEFHSVDARKNINCVLQKGLKVNKKTKVITYSTIVIINENKQGNYIPFLFLYITITREHYAPCNFIFRIVLFISLYYFGQILNLYQSTSTRTMLKFRIPFSRRSNVVFVTVSNHATMFIYVGCNFHFFDTSFHTLKICILSNFPKNQSF